MVPFRRPKAGTEHLSSRRVSPGTADGVFVGLHRFLLGHRREGTSDLRPVHGVRPAPMSPTGSSDVTRAADAPIALREGQQPLRSISQILRRSSLRIWALRARQVPFQYGGRMVRNPVRSRLLLRFGRAPGGGGASSPQLMPAGTTLCLRDRVLRIATETGWAPGGHPVRFAAPACDNRLSCRDKAYERRSSAPTAHASCGLRRAGP